MVLISGRCDPPDLRHVFGMLAAGEDNLGVAFVCVHGVETGQCIEENIAAGREVAFGPVRDHV